MKYIYYIAACDYCQWVSPQCDSLAAAQKEAKHHHNENPHRGEDTPLFE